MACLLGRLGFLLYGQGREREAVDALRRARDRGGRLPTLDVGVTQLELNIHAAELRFVDCY